MSRKIVVLDGYTENPGDLSWDAMKQYGEVTVYDRTPKDKVVERIGDAEIAFTNKTVITQEEMKQCRNLKFIGVLATGYNIVDLEGAKENDIIVSNVPAYSTMSVAQHTMALLLELTNYVGVHTQAVCKGEWCDSPDFCFCKAPLMELAGKTMGIIGFGQIGRAVADLAQSFGMKVIAYGHRGIKEEYLKGNTESVSLQELFARSDVISLHCPYTKENHGMINKSTIADMKEGVMIINTSRGPLIEESDLAAALESGKVSGAAVDVISKEPMERENPLFKAPHMVITPHIAWASKEARERLMEIATANLKAYVDGKPANVVNK